MRPSLLQALEILFGTTLKVVRAEGGSTDLDKLGSSPVFSVSPSGKLTNILKSKGYTHFRHFAVLPSKHMPRWLLPIGIKSGTTLVGTRVYLPQKWVPRALKNVLVRMIRMGWDGWSRSEILIASRGPLPLELLTTAITHEDNPTFALSFGRRLAVRKLSVQVMRADGEILGYMKLLLVEAATGRVRNEAMALKQLWNFPTLRPHIPQLMHAGAWNGSYILFQSALPGELGPASFTEMHQEFLQTLGKINRIERTGQSLIEEIGPKWEKAAVLLGAKWKELGQEVLRRSVQVQGRLTIPCGISHGDFAP